MAPPSASATASAAAVADAIGRLNSPTRASGDAEATSDVVADERKLNVFDTRLKTPTAMPTPAKSRSKHEVQGDLRTALASFVTG
eukprot:4883154-Pleurochrysis_carterae.AAC.1